MIYNPPITDPDLGLRRSVLQESVRLADALLGYGLQTIVFGRTRRAVELILTSLRERGGADAERRCRDDDTAAGQRRVAEPTRLERDDHVLGWGGGAGVGAGVGGMGAGTSITTLSFCPNAFPSESVNRQIPT